MLENPEKYYGELFLNQRFPKSDFRFFPPNVLGASLEEHQILEHYYGAQLDALQERPWYPVNEVQAEQYRLLYLPTFDNAQLITLKRNNKTWRVGHKRCDGDCGFTPGKLITDTGFNLSQRESHQFERFFDNAQFWSMPTYEEAMGLDGSHEIMEGIRGGEYHVVGRWSPHDTPFADLVEFMLGIPRSWFGRLFHGALNFCSRCQS